MRRLVGVWECECLVLLCFCFPFARSCLCCWSLCPLWLERKRRTGHEAGSGWVMLPSAPGALREAQVVFNTAEPIISTTLAASGAQLLIPQPGGFTWRVPGPLWRAGPLGGCQNVKSIHWTRSGVRKIDRFQAPGGSPGSPGGLWGPFWLPFFASWRALVLASFLVWSGEEHADS